jgi:hypothetical protein
VTPSIHPDSLREARRFVWLGFAVLWLVACSRKSSGVATAGSSVTASKATAALCRPAGKDLQAVQLDVDAKFIADHGVADILDPVWWSADIYGSVADYDRCLTPFTREQRILFAVLWYQGEVDNGGHTQFLYNSTGIVYPDAVSGMRELNLAEGVDILSEAGRRMGGTPARDRTARGQQLDQSHADFDDLDTRFYDLDKKVNLSAVMKTYMRSHPAAFAFHGTVHIPRSMLEIRKEFAVP